MTEQAPARHGKPLTEEYLGLIMLSGFLLITQLAGAVYLAHGRPPSLRFDLLTHLGLLWLTAYWFAQFSRRHRIAWVMDMGLFLFVAWWIVIPYYVLRVRGVRGLWTLGAFGAAYLAASLAGTLLYALLAP